MLVAEDAFMQPHHWPPVRVDSSFLCARQLDPQPQHQRTRLSQLMELHHRRGDPLYGRDCAGYGCRQIVVDFEVVCTLLHEMTAQQFAYRKVMRAFHPQPATAANCEQSMKKVSCRNKANGCTMDWLQRMAVTIFNLDRATS